VRDAIRVCINAQARSSQLNLAQANPEKEFE